MARWSTLAAGAACAALAWAASGTAGAVSAGLGVLVVLGFFLSGIVPLLIADAAPVSAGVGSGLLLLTYTLRLALAVALLAVAARVDGLEERWLGVSILVAAVAWCAGLFLGWSRAQRSQ